MIILLCISCLAGATFALFTNDPDDGTIGIITTTGEVRVGIFDTDGNDLEQKSLSFITTSGPKETHAVLFEPGSTFYTQGFVVTNEGSVPVKYTLSVSKTKDISLAEFKKAFDIWVVEEINGEVDLNDARRLENFEGRIGVDGESVVYFLFIKMKEGAGNTFQGQEYSGIGITVCAVQNNGSFEE